MDGEDCDDLNEWDSVHSCDVNTTCANGIGTCDFNAGLHGDSFQCSDVNKYRMGSHQCTQFAGRFVKFGSYQCDIHGEFNGDGVNVDI